MYLTDIGVSKQRYHSQSKKNESWQKLIAKINRGINPAEYYNEEAVKPCFDFYSMLSRVKALPHITVRIPTSIIIQESGNYVILHHGPKGVMERLTEKIKYAQYEKMLKQKRSQLVASLEEDQARHVRDRLSAEGSESLALWIEFLSSEDSPDFIVREK